AIERDDALAGCVVGVELSVAIGIRLDQQRRPTGLDEVTRVGEVNAIPCSEFAAPVRRRANPLEDRLDDAVLAVLAVDVARRVEQVAGAHALALAATNLQTAMRRRLRW